MRRFNAWPSNSPMLRRLLSFLLIILVGLWSLLVGIFWIVSMIFMLVVGVIEMILTPVYILIWIITGKNYYFSISNWIEEKTDKIMGF